MIPPSAARIAALGECGVAFARRAATVMVRASLSLLLLMAACGGRDRRGSDDTAKQPVTVEPKAIAAEPIPPKTEPSPTPAPEPTGDPEPTEPFGPPAYRRPGRPATGVDEFVFWGWSPDGRRFAFETYFPGPGMAECEGEAELTIVEATVDRYATDGHVVVRHRDPSAQPCDPPDLREELGYRRDPRLRREGISAELGTGPLALEGSGESWSFELPDGQRATLVFRVRHGTEDPMEAADGAAYELRLQRPDQEEIVIEPGLRRRPWIMDYSLEQGMVFLGPDGTNAAIMVAQQQVIPEGTRTTWMANGVTLR